MKPSKKTFELDIDHVRHEISTVETIAEGVSVNIKADPKLAEELAKSATKKLRALLEFIDAHSEDGELL